MSLTLPKLQIRMPITNMDGTPSVAFHRFFNVEFAGAIERNDAAQEVVNEQLALQLAQIVTALEAAQIAVQTANAAQEAVDQAGGTGVSGSAAASVSLTSNGVWVSGPQVDLAGLVAGNLTITGSGPQNDVSTDVDGSSSSGQWRVVEIEAGVDSVVFTGSFSVSKSGSVVIVTNESSSAAASFSLARTNTGSISYRLDARKSSGSILTGLSLYLYARRSA